MSDALSREAVRAHVLRDWLDADGRPLGEHASAIHYARCRDEVPCPYPGSRHGLPMERGALRQIREHWPFVLATVAGLSPAGATVHEAWRASAAALAAPFLLPRPTPSAYAALYKTCVGLHQCLTFLLLGGEEVADLPLAELHGGSAGFAAWLEGEGWLRGAGRSAPGRRGSSRRCIGPPAAQGRGPAGARCPAGPRPPRR